MIYLRRCYRFQTRCIAVILLSLCATQTPIISASDFDIVINGGRVIDPETGLDGVRNIGITGNRIVEISSSSLTGTKVIDASGLVVAPGFIDLHVHGRTNVEQEFQLHDGLTTALELEWGIENLKEWYQSREASALINYGASVNWPYQRFKSLDKYDEEVQKLLEMTISGQVDIEYMFNAIHSAAYDQLSTDEITITHENIIAGLHDGGLGIGAPIGYLPTTNPNELYQLFKLAAEIDVPVFSHVRNPDIISIQEVINNAILFKTSLHIVHLNSMSLGKIDMALDMVKQAQESGFDITTEVYPYTAASTAIQSAIFSPGWQQRLGITYDDLQWVATGERLTADTFEAYRKEGGVLIIHMMKPEWINKGIAAPGVIVASDGMVYAKLAHPRTAGTFARVLGKYVRQDKIIDLMTAIRKMTLLPAQRLEGIAPMMKSKGRIQKGMDADITIFNPDTIIDKATFEHGPVFSEGVEYVLVNGVVALENGKTVVGVFPGKAITSRFKTD